MQFYLIGSLIFAFIVAIFALWNSTEAIVRFPLVGEFTTSLALVKWMPFPTALLRVTRQEYVLSKRKMISCS